MKKGRGFSLIEIMSVVAIIAILAAIAIPMYSKQQCKGRWGEVPNCLSDIALRMENYRTNHGAYPDSDSVDVLDVLNVGSALCGEYYTISVESDATEYFIEAADTQKKLPCSANQGDDVWLLSNTSPKILHIKNSVDGKIDDDPRNP